MDFTLDSEQTALRDAVRGLLKGYDAEHRREVVKEDPGFDEKMWGRLAEMGLLGLPFAEDDGGMGAGPVELSVVAEEIGRVNAPEPFVESVVLAGGAGRRARHRRSRRRRCSGRSPRASRSLAAARARARRAVGPRRRWGHRVRRQAHRRQGARARRRPRRPARRSRPSVGDGVGVFLVEPGDGVSVSSYTTLDGTRAARVTFDGAPATRLGDGSTDDLAALERVVAAAKIAYCHEARGR